MRPWYRAFNMADKSSLHVIARQMSQHTICITKDSSALRIISYGDNVARMAWHCIERSFCSTNHVVGHWPGYQEQIGMPWRCNKMEAQTLDVIFGVLQCSDAQLATIGGSRVEMPNKDRSPPQTSNPITFTLFRLAIIFSV